MCSLEINDLRNCLIIPERLRTHVAYDFIGVPLSNEFDFAYLKYLVIHSRCLTAMMLRNNRLSSELQQTVRVFMRDAMLKHRAHIVYSAIETAHGLFANIDDVHKEVATREYARAIEGLEMEAVDVDNALQGTVLPAFQNSWISPLKTLQILQPEFRFNPAYPNALTISAKAGELELVRLLDPQIDFTNNEPLHAACVEGHTEIVRFLLQRVKSKQRNLNVACQNGHTEIVRMLLVHINPNAKNLMDACRNGFTNIVRLLYEHVHVASNGANVASNGANVASNGANVAHACAFANVASDVANVAPALANMANSYHIELACERGYTDIVNILLTHVKPTERALYIACKHGHADIVRKLIHHIDPNMHIIEYPAAGMYIPTRYSPLQIACFNGHLNVVKVLLPHVSKPFILPKVLCGSADIKLIQLLMNYYTFTSEDLEHALYHLNYDVIKLLRAHVEIDACEMIRFANKRISLSSDRHIRNFFHNEEEHRKNETLRILLMIQESLITPFDVLETIVESACTHNTVMWIHTIVNPRVAFAYLEYAIRRCQSHRNFKTVVDAILTHIPQQIKLASLDDARNLLLSLSLCPTDEKFLSIVPFARKEDVIEIAAMSPRASSLLYALLDFPDLEPATAIRFACQFGHVDILRRVLASPHKDRLGADVIDLARQYGHPEIEDVLQQTKSFE